MHFHISVGKKKQKTYFSSLKTQCQYADGLLTQCGLYEETCYHQDEDKNISTSLPVLTMLGPENIRKYTLF